MRRFVVGALVAAVVVPATALAAGVTGTFSGRTSQGEHVKLIVKRGDIKRGSKIPYAMTCQHGTLGGTMEPYGPIRHHRFAVSIHNTETVGHGYKARHRSSLKISIGTRHASGSIIEQATVVNSKGAVVDHCSAAVLFTASR